MIQVYIHFCNVYSDMSKSYYIYVEKERYKCLLKRDMCVMYKIVFVLRLRILHDTNERLNFYFY